MARLLSVRSIVLIAVLLLLMALSGSTALLLAQETGDSPGGELVPLGSGDGNTRHHIPNPYGCGVSHDAVHHSVHKPTTIDAAAITTCPSTVTPSRIGAKITIEKEKCKFWKFFCKWEQKKKESETGEGERKVTARAIIGCVDGKYRSYAYGWVTIYGQTYDGSSPWVTRTINDCP